MKPIFAIFLVLALLSSCGERQRRVLEDKSLNNELVDGLLPNPVAENDCQLSPFGEDHILECDYLTLLVEGNILSKIHETDQELVMIASKKNGGTGGSQWVDAVYELETAALLALPTSIPAVGNAGNGQKLYIKFNDSIDCVWFSEAQSSYKNYQCYRAGIRDASKPSGFSEGELLSLNEIEEVEKIEMHVNGASGSGVITTATAVFVKM